MQVSTSHECNLESLILLSSEQQNSDTHIVDIEHTLFQLSFSSAQLATQVCCAGI